MGASQRRVLLAGLRPLMRDVQEALAADFATVSAEDTSEAQRQLEEEAPPDCVVIAYHFDQLQAVRLIRYIRGQAKFADLPIILVCVVRYNFGAQEDIIRGAYKDLGVNEYFNLYEQIQKQGAKAALDQLRATVLAATRSR